jgi:hypothetical protein
MFRMLIDTCVWLDLAKDPKQKPVLGVVEELLKLGMVNLIVPRVVLDEFRRNRERIAKDSAKSLSTHFRLVKEAIGKIGGDKRTMRVVLSHLDDVDHKIPIIGGEAVATLNRIEKLLSESTIIETSDEVRLRAAKRAIEKKAPFHHDKNAMGDAILIETYADCVRDKAASGVRFVFVTHNKNDFSIESGNHKLPHPDFSRFFSRIKSLYFINLPEALRRVEPSLVTDIMLEQAWTQEPRGLTEILEAEDVLFHQVWYNRHWNKADRYRAGRDQNCGQGNLPSVTRCARNDSARYMGRGSEVCAERRTSLRQEEPRTVGRFRVGHDQRQALGTSVGLGRRVGQPLHVEDRMSGVGIARHSFKPTR